MARTYVYHRTIDAVHTHVNLGGSLNPSVHGIKIKEEPVDSDPNTNDEPSPFSINTRNRAKLRESRSLGPPNGEQSFDQPVTLERRSLRSSGLRPSKDIDDGTKAATLPATPSPASRKAAVGIASPKECDVCFFPIRNRRDVDLHKKLSTVVHYRCSKCYTVFGSRHTVKRHQKNRVCRASYVKSIPTYDCHFCGDRFSAKDYVQCHLFHVHAALIDSSAMDADVIGVTMERSISSPGDSSPNVRTPCAASRGLESSNSPVDTAKSKSKSRSKVARKLDEPNHELDQHVQPPSTPQVASLNKSLAASPSHLEKKLKTAHDSCATPARELRQTTLLDFLSFGKKAKNEPLSPRKDPGGSGNRSPTPSSSKTAPNTPASRVATPTTDKPFVQIHVDGRLMMELLENWIKTEPTSPRSSTDSTPARTACERSNRTTRYRGTAPVQDSELRMRFDCKECTVPLERCDAGLANGSFGLDEGENVFVEALPVQAAKKVKLNESNEPDDSAPVESKEAESDSCSKDAPVPPEARAEVKPRRTYKCHVCGKRFSLRENLREHLGLFHVIYISSICKARYSSVDKLLNHYLRQHIVVFKRRECCVCSERFRTTAALRRHLVVHCLKTVRSKRDTVDVEPNCNGIRKHHRCPGCGKRFWLRSCLLAHQNVCRRMRAQRTTEQASPPTDHWQVESSTNDPSSFDQERTSNEVPSNPDHASRYSMSENGIDVPELKQETPAIARTVSPTEFGPVCPASPKVFFSSSPTKGSYKRLINGIACVRGYQADTMDKMKFPCTICGKQFHTFQNLCIHERTFCKPAFDRCTICSTAFPTKRLLQLHMLATHTPSCVENYKFFCRFCNQGFLKKGSLYSHERHFHVDRITKQHANRDCSACNVCNLIFDSYERFIEHNMYYYREQVFECTICATTFQGMYRLHHHYKLMHYPDSARKSYIYTCEICYEGFNYESHFHAHKLHVHANDAAAMQQHNAAGLHGRQDHTYAIASENVAATMEPIEIPAKTYTCPVCCLNFTNEKDFTLHQTEYATDGDYSCEQCDRKCRTATILAKHRSLNHTGCDISSTYKCRFCGEVLTTSTSMMSHEKHFHGDNLAAKMENGVPRDQQVNASAPRTSFNVRDTEINADPGFACLTCGMKFDNELSLKNHLLEYANIGKHSCVICQRKFTEPCLLEAHQVKHSTTNTTASPNRCPICNEGFQDVTSVRTHVLHLHRYESFSFDGSNMCKISGLPTATAKPVPNKDVHRDENPIAPPVIPNRSAAATVSAADKHQQERSVACPNCDPVSRSNRNLPKHQSRIASSGDHRCNVCSRRFPSRPILDEHTRMRPDAQARLQRHVCPHCPEKFRSPAAVYVHIVHAHGTDKSLASSGEDPNVLFDDSFDLEEEDAAAVRKRSTTEGGKDAANERDETPLHTGSRYSVNAAKPLAHDSSARNLLPLDNEASDVFYFTCGVCNSKYPSLKRFQAHYRTVHAPPTQTTVPRDPSGIGTTSSLTSEADSTIRNATGWVDEADLLEETLPLPSTNCDSSTDPGMPSNANAHPSNERPSCETVEIVWEKKKCVECVTIDDSAAAEPDVMLIHERPVSVIACTARDSAQHAIGSDRDHSETLRGKSFATISL